MGLCLKEQSLIALLLCIGVHSAVSAYSNGYLSAFASVMQNVMGVRENDDRSGN